MNDKITTTTAEQNSFSIRMLRSLFQAVWCDCIHVGESVSLIISQIILKKYKTKKNTRIRAICDAMKESAFCVHMIKGNNILRIQKDSEIRILLFLSIISHKS